MQSRPQGVEVELSRARNVKKDITRYIRSARTEPCRSGQIMFRLLKHTVFAFVEDEALSRGAAIAFYTVTSIAPILLIVIAIAGLAFGREAAEGALTAQISNLMGQQTAEVLQSAVANASGKSSGIFATIIGFVTGLRRPRAFLVKCNLL
jgi:uncharacterized BrkB/YihY/UPF0761 family membrane protein